MTHKNNNQPPFTSGPAPKAPEDQLKDAKLLKMASISVAFCFAGLALAPWAASMIAGDEKPAVSPVCVEITAP